MRESRRLVRSLDQPLQHRIRIDRKLMGDRADAQAFRQSGHRPYQLLRRHTLVMKERPVGFEEVSTANEAVPLPPGAATGMAIGPQIAQSGPVIVVTLRCGTIVLWGDHLMLTSARRAPQWRRTGRALRGWRQDVLTGGTAGLDDEARKWL